MDSMYFGNVSGCARMGLLSSLFMGMFIFLHSTRDFLASVST